MGWMAHGKWKETKQLPGTAGPGDMLGCCLNFFHFRCDIHPIRPVVVSTCIQSRLGISVHVNDKESTNRARGDLDPLSAQAPSFRPRNQTDVTYTFCAFVSFALAPFLPSSLPRTPAPARRSVGTTLIAASARRVWPEPDTPFLPSLSKHRQSESAYVLGRLEMKGKCYINRYVYSPFRGYKTLSE